MDTWVIPALAAAWGCFFTCFTKTGQASRMTWVTACAICVVAALSLAVTSALK